MDKLSCYILNLLFTITNISFYQVDSISFRTVVSWPVSRAYTILLDTCYLPLVQISSKSPHQGFGIWEEITKSCPPWVSSTVVPLSRGHDLWCFACLSVIFIIPCYPHQVGILVHDSRLLSVFST